MLTGTPASAASAAHDRQDPAQLLVGVDRLGAGPGRLAADVEDRRAGRGQREAVRDRGVGVEVAAAVGEGVGRDVDDPHQRPPGQIGDECDGSSRQARRPRG